MTPRKLKVFLVALSPFLAGAVSLFLGAYTIDPRLALKVLATEVIQWGPPLDTPERAILVDIRLPRVLLAALAGASLSGAGVVFQGLFRNPLVDPYILGISAGAAFGCALSVAFMPGWSVQGMAFGFGLLAVVLAYIVARTQGEISRLPLVLSGVIVSAFFTALVSVVKFLVDPHRLQGIVFWTMGSFSLADWKAFKVTSLGVSLGLVPLVFMRWRLNVLSLPEEEALALGVDVRRDRILFVVFSTFAVAMATAVCGIIGWVGLMVPHLLRMLFGPDHRTLLPLSLFGGATFMIAADTLSRTISNFDVPVGIITALTGAPFFIYLLRRGGREVWER